MTVILKRFYDEFIKQYEDMLHSDYMVEYYVNGEEVRMVYFNKEKLEGELKELEAITMKLESRNAMGDLTPSELCKIRSFINNRKVEIKYSLDEDKKVKGK